MCRRTGSMVEGVIEVPVVVLSEIGALRPVASDQAANPAHAFGAVHSRLADQVLRDALPYEVRYRTFLLACETPERCQLLLGELNLSAYHDAIFGNMMAFYPTDVSRQSIPLR